MRLIVADGSVLERITRTTGVQSGLGLSGPAYGSFCAALDRTAWAQQHQRRMALVDGTDVVASACCYDFLAEFDGHPIHVRGIGSVFVDPAHERGDTVRDLTARLVDVAEQDGADVVLLFVGVHGLLFTPHGFEHVPTTDVELTVVESVRYGAPMTPIRGGEDRDLAAIVAMGEARAARFRFHLRRDADVVKHAITRKRLHAGLAPIGRRQLRFVIAEEGVTAAAYAVITVSDGVWTIEECGDRDPSGARVGALLQALIAREPAELRPTIRAWLPPGFVPPQVSVVSAKPSADVMMMRALRHTAGHPRLSSGDVLYWRADIF